jgi:ribosomal protein L11 methyltransferase
MAGRPGPEPTPAHGPWVVSATVASQLLLPGAERITRDDFHGWLWERTRGLLGIDEGGMTVDDAAAHGLVERSLVIDAAAAPADRDWVADMPVAAVEWWFADEAAARAAIALVADVRGCEVRGIRVDTSSDHEAASRAAFGPIVVEGFGVVQPSWTDGAAGIAADGRATIFIEPGLGFGTGLHETTQLCLAAISTWHRDGGRLDRVLDFGSGSGILGIAAAVLGAGHVDAVEIDRQVHPALAANASRNAVAERVIVSAALPPDEAAYDLIVANIVAAVLIEHAAAVCRRLQAARGCLVLSGLLADEVPTVVERYAAELGVTPTVRERCGWHCLSFAAG